VIKLIYKLVRQKLIMAAACIFWLFCLVTFSVIPYSAPENSGGSDTSFRLDYLEHFIGYFLLAILAGLWRSDKNLSLSRSTIIMIITAGLVLSFILEYIQLFVPGRAYNLMDVFINAAGLLAGTLTVRFLILQFLHRSVQHK
jgi:VanZ family protein